MRSTRAAGFGKEVRRRIMIGTYVLSAGYYDAYYLRAQKVRTLIKRDFEDCFAAGVDAILTPATPSAAFAHRREGPADPVEMYLNDVFTVTVNMAGLPGISVPAGLDAQGLPLGLQLIGRPFDEETLFALGAVIEQAAGQFAPNGGGKSNGSDHDTRRLPAQCRQAAPARRALARADGAVVGRQGQLGQGARHRHGRGWRDCAWVHAYLHRVEGDVDNARYWYREARRAPAEARSRLNGTRSSPRSYREMPHRRRKGATIRRCRCAAPINHVVPATAASHRSA